MARSVHRLSAAKVAKTRQKGLHPDGGGLYLQVGAGGSKSWIFRYKIAGKVRDMGLGSVREVTLAEARGRAAEYRSLRLQYKDPIKERIKQRVASQSGSGQVFTFDDAKDAYISAHEKSWKNAKHRAQWRATLANYVTPVIGDIPVQDIDTASVLKILEPIWQNKTETASRIRGRIENILDWARARGLRDGENPARWRGHLEQLLPARSRVQHVRHHPALPYTDIPGFMALLRDEDSVTSFALEFLVLTAARTSEVLGAQWSEMSKKGVWIIPAGRMKGGAEHHVPLVGRAADIVTEMRAIRTNDYVFPGLKAGRSLSTMAMLMLLRRLGYDDVTVHGFRSSFRDWASEETNFSGEVAEAALAHTVRNKVEAAYRRGDLFKKRRQLMQAWTNYCCASSQQTEKTRSR